MQLTKHTDEQIELEADKGRAELAKLEAEADRAEQAAAEAQRAYKAKPTPDAFSNAGVKRTLAENAREQAAAYAAEIEPLLAELARRKQLARLLELRGLTAEWPGTLAAATERVERIVDDALHALRGELASLAREIASQRGLRSERFELECKLHEPRSDEVEPASLSWVIQHLHGRLVAKYGSLDGGHHNHDKHGAAFFSAAGSATLKLRFELGAAERAVMEARR